jgi:hypothetical protein
MKRNQWNIMLLTGAAAAAASAVGIASIDVYGPFSNSLNSETSRLEEFCERHWGVLSEDLTQCRFEQAQYFSLAPVRGGEELETGIAVQAGDLIRFEATESAIPLVGQAEYVVSGAEFRPAHSGMLSFRSSKSLGAFKLRKVIQTRCIRQVGLSISIAQCEDQ